MQDLKSKNRLTTEVTEEDLSSAYEETQEHEKNAGQFFSQDFSQKIKTCLTAKVTEDAE